MIKDELEKFSVHDLRGYARSVGVRAPTAKKKEQLIIEIKNILNGTLAPHYSKSGRPYIKKLQINTEEKVIEEKIKRLDNALARFREEVINIMID